METRRPKPGELYRHFKNKVYQIVTIATHSETAQELVIYQAMYGEFGIYARPLEMFVSEVDHQKYPRVTQRYRFEKIERNQSEVSNDFIEDEVVGNLKEDTQTQPKTQSEVPMVEKAVESNAANETNTEETADPRLLRFLDADTYNEKYKVLQEIEADMTDRLINDFSVILDVVIPEGDISTRFLQLKQCIATQARYENTRLR